MIADIDAGKIGCVIVKDMSRVGREYLQTGWYTEIFFRDHGVRFIAIGNGVDSIDQRTEEFTPFLNIVNEWYKQSLNSAWRKGLRDFDIPFDSRMIADTRPPPALFTQT